MAEDTAAAADHLPVSPPLSPPDEISEASALGDFPMAPLEALGALADLASFEQRLLRCLRTPPRQCQVSS